MRKKRVRRDLEQEMTEYVLYLRTEAGTISRKSFPYFLVLRIPCALCSRRGARWVARIKSVLGT